MTSLHWLRRRVSRFVLLLTLILLSTVAIAACSELPAPFATATVASSPTPAATLTRSATSTPQPGPPATPAPPALVEQARQVPISPENTAHLNQTLRYMEPLATSLAELVELLAAGTVGDEAWRTATVSATQRVNSAYLNIAEMRFQEGVPEQMEEIHALAVSGLRTCNQLALEVEAALTTGDPDRLQASGELVPDCQLNLITTVQAFQIYIDRRNDGGAAAAP